MKKESLSINRANPNFESHEICQKTGLIQTLNHMKKESLSKNRANPNVKFLGPPAFNARLHYGRIQGQACRIRAI